MPPRWGTSTVIVSDMVVYMMSFFDREEAGQCAAVQERGRLLGGTHIFPAINTS